jgi:DNA-binding response OmpR family regulator
MALETGADDYMVKPAPARELVARIRALHRRMNRPQSDRMLRIYIDPAQRCLIGATGERTALTEAEMSALDTLLDAGGVSVSREWLSRIALKRPLHADDRAVDQLVMKLRRKLASQGASDRVILSARRQGYMIADPSLFRAIPRPTPANSNGAHLNGTESVGAE